VTYKFTRVGTTIVACTLLLLSPLVTLAASDEDMAAIRAQLLALTKRLDRLEAENRELAATNTEMVKSNQKTTIALRLPPK